MEPRFGHDFSQVRLHTGARAEESAQEVGALAYTVGEHVVFGADQYAPAMTEGRRLLAHELSHVLQQQAAGNCAQAGCGRKAAIPDALAEKKSAMAKRIDDTAPRGAIGTGLSVHAATGLRRKVSPRLAQIRRKLAAKKPGEKEIHDVLLVLEALVGTDFEDTVAALAREDLVDHLLMNVGDADKIAMFGTLRRIKNAWPRTVTTTVGKTTVTTTVVGSCSPGQFQLIYNAALLGLQWLDRAIARTDAYLAKPGDNATQDVRAALDLHFHNTTDRVAHHVRGRLAHIRDDMLLAQGFSIECHGVWDKLCDVAGAYATSDQVVFCNSFFDGSRIFQAEAFIHEMAHAQVGGAHISDRGYQSERVLRLLSTAEALTNAESFGLFAQQLGTGKVPPMPEAKDKRADCPKDWWDWLQFAVAWAQRWNFNARLVTNSLTAAELKHWDPRQQQLLGGTSESTVDAAKKAFKTLDTKLRSPIKFECEPFSGGRCDEPGMLNYWYEFWSDFHICPLWRYQSTPEDHIEGLLLGLYGYLAGVGDNYRRQGYAKLAREWMAGGGAPSLTQVLGSTLWRSDRLRITVTPIEPKTPGQESFTENGTTPHPRMSDRLPVYQTEPGQAAELPFRCDFEFFVDDANMPRPAPFKPPRVSATLHFRDASRKIQQIFGTTETRPVYQGAGRRLSSAGGFLEGIFNRNGQLAVKARLEDPDTHITRVYDDLIQIRADRSAERPPVPPQMPKVEGCTGWEKNPEGFVKYVASYVAIHEINPVIDTRVRLTGCNDSHQCTVAFPDGLNMTVLWGPAAHKVIAKWDDQGLSQRRVYDYSCAVGRVNLVPYVPPGTSAPATP